MVAEAAPKPVKKDSEFDPEDAARRKAKAKAWWVVCIVLYLGNVGVLGPFQPCRRRRVHARSRPSIRAPACFPFNISVWVGWLVQCIPSLLMDTW